MTPLTAVLRTRSAIPFLATVLLTAAATLFPARSGDFQMFRIRANGPTTITGLAPSGDLTWTSNIPDLEFTIESSTGGAGRWGAVLSGVQSGPGHSARIPLAAATDNVVSVLTTYSGTPLPNYEIRLVRPTGAWPVVAKSLSADDGWCFFHNVPPDNYLVGVDETPLYTEVWWDNPVILGVPQTNHFRIHMTRKDFGLQPEGDVGQKTPFSWGWLTDSIFYGFTLYRLEPSGLLTELEQVRDILDREYVPLTAFEQNTQYLWTIAGFDHENNPVSSGRREIRTLFAGNAGTPRKGSSVFGLAKFSIRRVPGCPIVLTKPDNTVVARATTDEQGWFVVRDLAPGDYWLGHEHSDFSAGMLLVSFPADAGHHVLALTRRSAINSPRHETVTTRRPVFLWSGIPESVAYTFTLSGGNPLTVVHERSGLTLTSYALPLSLGDGDYFWNVSGLDAAGNPVLTAGARFTVQAP